MIPLRQLPALLILMTASALADEVADPNVGVDTSTLPPIGATVEGNPYRNLPAAIAIGREAYNQACARCHGIDGNHKGQVGLPLLRMDRACGPIADPAIKAMCLRDNDDFFMKSVQNGKTRVGIVHMPAWKDILQPEAIWAIRSFLESRKR